MADLRLGPGFQEALRSRLDSPEGQEAMQRLIAHVAEFAVDAMTPEQRAAFATPEGRKELERFYPEVIEAYFRALRNPRPK